jgi:Ca2+-binding RTX toxin-like protein
MPFKLKFTHFSAGSRFTGLAGEGDKVHSDVGWVYGGTGNDTLTGTNNTNGGFNVLRGMTGNDIVSGLVGNDWLDSHAYRVVRNCENIV